MTTAFPELETLKLVVSLPSYDGRALNRVPLMHLARQVPNAIPIPTQTSLLAACFNITFCAAMRLRSEGYTHFLMCHDDIFPLHQNWFEELWGAYRDSGASLICAVSPIKSEKGLTSIGIDVEDVDAEKEARELLEKYGNARMSCVDEIQKTIPDLEEQIIKAMTGYPARKRMFASAPRRLTLRECFKMPTTFTHPRILLNTGCMLFDMREPWVDQAGRPDGPGKVFFHIDDSIQWNNGEPHTRGASEDWNFTRMARAAGCPHDKIFATLAMPLEHVGQMRFPTDHAWGTLSKDDAVNTDGTVKK